MSDPKKLPNADLFAQIQKILDATGSITKGAPNLTPTPGSEREQHRPPREAHREKKAYVGDFIKKLAPSKYAPAVENFVHKHEDALDAGGLGILAAMPAMTAIHELRKDKDERDNGEVLKSGVEEAGLGVLAAAPLMKAYRQYAGSGAHLPKMASVLDELSKMGFVSDSEAARALDSLEALEQDKPTKRQTLGYMAAGAALTPAFHMAGNAIRKRPLLGDAAELKNLVGGARVKHQALDAASHAVKGGLGGTAVSMAQRHIDRSDKTNTLKAYLAQHEAQDPDLQKAAAAKKKKDEEKKPSNLKKFVGGMGAGVGMTLGNQALGKHLNNKMEEADPALFDAVKAKAPKGLNIHEGPHEDIRGAGPHFLAGKETPLRAQLPASMSKALDVEPYVSTAGSKNPSILAHELGHADIQNNRFGRMLQNPATTTAGAVAGGIGTLTGGLSGMSDNQTIQRAGVLAPAVLSLPQLAYEAGASIQGLRRMRGAGANRAQMLQGLKTLAPAFGTYATRAGVGTAGAYQAQGMVGGIRGMINGQEKEAGAPRLVGPRMPGLAGSGTPSMPMPKPKPGGLGVVG